MNDSQPPMVLAIDGGGTRCRVAARDGKATVSVETGSANVSTDFDGAVRAIVEGLETLATQLGRSSGALSQAPTFAGLAGVTGPAVADRLRAALPLARLRIEDDRPAALRGALGRKDGIVAHCGTGSFYAAQIGDTTRFAGGWGPILGDEASAQWVGRAALRVTLENVDGWHTASALSERILGDFGDSAGIVRFAGTALPAEFGDLARLVTAFADHGDALARQVMAAGAEHIVRAMHQMGWTAGLPVCLTGGIGPHYAPYLPPAMRDSVAPPEATPLDGAISLAEDFAREIADERG